MNLPKRDPRPGILVANGMPRHPKIAPLSDGAFRTLVTAWCYCSEQESDGRIPDVVWRTMGSARARKELMTSPVMLPGASPMVTQGPGYVECHDYLIHQRSAREIASLRSSRGESGNKGAHMRWHVGRRVVDPSCPFCQEGDANETE